MNVGVAEVRVLNHEEEVGDREAQPIRCRLQTLADPPTHIDRQSVAMTSPGFDHFRPQIEIEGPSLTLVHCHCPGHSS